MYSISEVSKATDLTARSLRHYEEKGLITVLHRSGNGYRYYSKETVERLKQIKKLKMMDFSLSEIKDFLDYQDENLKEALIESLSKKRKSVDLEINRLIKTKQDIENQLLATKDFFKGKILEKGQRRLLMETIKSEILTKLKGRREITYKDLEYLKREDYLFDTEDKRKFINVVKNCLEYARKEGIKLGPARGASPALWNYPKKVDTFIRRFA